MVSNQLRSLGIIQASGYQPPNCWLVYGDGTSWNAAWAGGVPCSMLNDPVYPWDFPSKMALSMVVPQNCCFLCWKVDRLGMAWGYLNSVASRVHPSFFPLAAKGAILLQTIESDKPNKWSGEPHCLRFRIPNWDLPSGHTIPTGCISIAVGYTLLAPEWQKYWNDWVHGEHHKGDSGDDSSNSRVQRHRAASRGPCFTLGGGWWSDWWIAMEKSPQIIGK